MADLALAAVGAAIGSLPGGIAVMEGLQIGLLVGNILFPPSGPKIDRGRLEEVRVQNAQQGSPIPLLFGRNRIAGTVTWATGLIESSKTETQGGLKGGGMKTEVYSYRTSFQIYLCEGPLKPIRRIWANEEVIYDAREPGDPVVAERINVENITFYDGTQTLPDPTIEADKGVGNVPASLGIAHIVFKDYPIDERGFSNFSFEVESTHEDLKEALEDIAARIGLEPEEYDFSEAAGLPIHGLIVGARTEGVRILEVFCQANWLDLIETGGKLTVKKRTGASLLTIPASHIGASSSGQSRPYVETTRAEEVDLPRKFQVNYFSEKQDFQSFTQTATRGLSSSENQDGITFPMALPDSTAKYLSDSILMERHTSRNAHLFSLPYRYLKLDPGDVVTITDSAGNLRRVRLLDMGLGMVAEIVVVGVDDDPVIYEDPELPFAEPTGTSGTVNTSGVAGLIVGEVPAPFDNFADAPTLYIAAGRDATGWGGGYAETTPRMGGFGIGFSDRIATLGVSCVFGKTVAGSNGILGDAGANLGFVIDRVNTVRVTLTAGSLSSITEEELIAGQKNLAIIGGEVFQFQTATLVSGKTYTLSNLLRYRRGSDYLLAEAELAGEAVHSAEEPFVLINSGLGSYAYRASEIGSSHSYRLIEFERDYSGGLPSYGTASTLEGLSRKPYGPAALSYSGDRSGGPANVVLSWIRRVRKNGGLLSYSDAPLDEETEAYELEIWTDDLSTLKRTVSGITGPTWTYTTTQQAADGLSSSDFKVRVFQVSQEPGIGRGLSSQFLTVPS